MNFIDQLCTNLNEVVSYPSIKSIAVLSGTLAYSAVGGAGGAYASLLFLICMDTVLGIITAIKYNEFSFNKWKKLPVKIILYWSTIACALHVDIAVQSIVEDISLIDELMKMYKLCILWFCTTELVSIGRKINRWGINVPIKEIVHTIKNIFVNSNKLPTIDNIKNSKRNKYENYED